MLGVRLLPPLATAHLPEPLCHVGASEAPPGTAPQHPPLRGDCVRDTPDGQGGLQASTN